MRLFNNIQVQNQIKEELGLDVKVQDYMSGSSVILLENTPQNVILLKEWFENNDIARMYGDNKWCEAFDVNGVFNGLYHKN